MLTTAHETATVLGEGLLRGRVEFKKFDARRNESAIEFSARYVQFGVFHFPHPRHRRLDALEHVYHR